MIFLNCNGYLKGGYGSFAITRSNAIRYRYFKLYKMKVQINVAFLVSHKRNIFFAASASYSKIL